MPEKTTLGIEDEYTARKQLRARLRHVYEMELEDVAYVMLILSMHPYLASQKVNIPGSRPIYPLFVLVRTPACTEDIQEVYHMYPEAVLSNPELKRLVSAGCDPHDVPALWGHNTTLNKTKLRINSNFQSLSVADVQALSKLFPKIQSFTGDTPMGFAQPQAMTLLCQSITSRTNNLTKLQLDVPHGICKKDSTARQAFVEMITRCKLNHLQLYCDNDLEDLDETTNDMLQALAEALTARTSTIAFLRLQWFFLTCASSIKALYSILSAKHGARRLHCSDLHIVCPPVYWMSVKEDGQEEETGQASLREIHISGECSLPMDPLLCQLEQNSALQQVDIPSELYNFQTEEEADAICTTDKVVSLLQKCPKLEKLRLASHALSTDLLRVAPLLKNNGTLKEFEVSTSNDVEYMQTEQQLKAVVEMLESNTTLLSCKVHVKEWGNTIRHYLERIDYGAKLNRAGRRLAGDPEITVDTLVQLLAQSTMGWEQVPEKGKGTRKLRRKIAQQKASICYDLLRKNPAIWSSLVSNQS